MNILFSHFEIKSSAAASAAGEVKLKRQNYGQRNVPHYIHMSEYKIVMQFLESFNFIHLIQRELISKK